MGPSNGNAAREKLCSLAEAVDQISDGDIVAIGGHTTRRHPMALVREVVRQGKRRLHVVAVGTTASIWTF